MGSVGSCHTWRIFRSEVRQNVKNWTRAAARVNLEKKPYHLASIQNTVIIFKSLVRMRVRRGGYNWRLTRHILCFKLRRGFHQNNSCILLCFPWWCLVSKHHSANFVNAQIILGNLWSCEWPKSKGTCHPCWTLQFCSCQIQGVSYV